MFTVALTPVRVDDAYGRTGTIKVVPQGGKDMKGWEEVEQSGCCWTLMKVPYLYSRMAASLA